MTLVGLLCWEHGWLSFPALKKKKNKSFFILIKVKYFC